MDKLDWTLIRSFLALAETGSLSAAARALGLSQPTLSRHLAEMEAALGFALAQRHARGLALTPEAQALLPAARAMREAAARLSLAAQGQDGRLQGTVRITASRIVSYHLLPPLLAALRQAEPGIEIDLVPSDHSENLLYHQADIAIRMYRPVQLDLVTRHVVDLPMALYAGRGWVARHGLPQSRDALMAAEILGFDRDETILRMMAALGAPRVRGDFALRCDDQLVYLALLRAGCGIGGVMCCIGDADPALQRLPPVVSLPALPLWLATAAPLAQAPRIRRVWDALAEGLRNPAPALPDPMPDPAPRPSP